MLLELIIIFHQIVGKASFLMNHVFQDLRNELDSNGGRK